MERSEVLAAMAKGFESLDSWRGKHPLEPAQLEQIDRAVEGIQNYRKYMEQTGGRFERPEPDFAAPPKRELVLRGHRRQAADGGYHLQRREVEEFARRGVIGPFELLSADEAEEIRRYCHEEHERDWGGRLVLKGDVEAALRAANLWNVNYSGAYQALYHPVLWDLLARDEIVHRLVSLLGNDLICWRSQFFEKPPGADGTYWHQAGTFRESSLRPKLLPTRTVDYATAQLTVWIALTDSRIDNGCMRMLPGSFYDSRPEDFFFFALENLPRYLSQLPDEDVRKLLHVAWFSPGSFYRARAMYELATRRIEDLFSDRDVVDLEVPVGSFIIFSSMNLHGSYPNRTESDSRLAFAGRFTTPDVRVLPGFEYDVFPTPRGLLRFDLDHTGSMLVSGEDRYGFNKLVERPSAGNPPAR